MKHAIGFVEPTGLIVDCVGKAAPRLGCTVLAKRVSAQGIDGAIF